MSKILDFLIAYQSYIIPLAIYLALNLAKRDYLVNNPSPVIRGIANVLESVLVLEWDRWGGSFKGLRK